MRRCAASAPGGPTRECPRSSSRTAPLPDGTPPGEPGRCYVETVSWAWASEGELVYVEGLAWDLAYPVEHAWCATADGTARDLTWPRPGLAYLGIPVHAEAAARIMSERRGPLLYAVEGLGSELAVEWAREGIPAELLADVGRLPDGGSIG